MATMSITVTDQARAWIDDKVAREGRESPSALIEALIQRELVREEKIANMQRLVDEGRASGVSSRTFDEIIADARREALARLGRDAA